MLSAQFLSAVLVSSALGFLSLLQLWIFFTYSFHHGSCHQTGLWLCLASTLQGQAEVVPAGLNLRNSTIDIGGVYSFLGSVSLQQKFEAVDGPVL